ncbi:M61 metallopeptidase family protein [Natronorubrum tibetense]|uniref:Glycyl aminopeptidase n=1 Tax=Natronorubrum tibetense GA33 TaxID=1114856 RepID=L9VGU7_9EURY|nr:hypothetical protein [Natronorubrum tibetense]ELY36281.1 hypothetical protein C496_22044 [Natronorubrum tibetense GA33]
MKSRFAVCVIVLLLLASLPAGIAGAGGFSSGPDTSGASEPAIATAASDGSPSAMADDDDVLHQRTELRHLPDRPGEFEVETTFEPPEPMRGLEVDLHDDAAVVALEGFEETGDGTYRWDEATAEPSLRYEMPSDRTGDVRHDHEDRDGYTFVDTGEWGVVQVPSVGLSLRTPQSVTLGIEETVTVDGEGAAGDDIAFFGPVEEYERTVDGETIRLVVPEAADLMETPDDILESIAAGSERLDVGSSSDEVFVVAVPTDVDWGPRGVQYGDADAWVAADAELEAAANVWLHEYVHVRQGFASGETTTDVRWLVEAQAEYYPALLGYETGTISFGEFGNHLERGERSPYADGALNNPSTWADRDTDYVKGPLVYGEIDRQLRLATDGDRTLEDVFRQLNAQNGAVSEADFLTALEDAGGSEVRSVAERYTQTDATPEMWSRWEHGDAFDQSAAIVEYGLGSEPIEVAAQSWERWDSSEIDGVEAGSRNGDAGIDGGDVMAVPAGESVTVPVAMANVDDRVGTADATLEVNGDIVALEQRHLEPGERATTRLSWEPAEPGLYNLRVGDDRLTVFVRSSPSLTVTDLRVDPDGVDPGETVTATATVTADGDRPAAGTLPFQSANGVVTGDPVAIAPGETGTTTVELTFDDDGRYEVTAGEQSTTVTVGGGLSRAVSAVDSIPGFSGVAVIATLALVVTIGMLRRRQ